MGFSNKHIPGSQPHPAWEREVQRDVLESTANVAYILDGNLRISYCNPAWDRFALANEGELATAEKVLGTPVLAYVSKHLRHFYQVMFDRSRAEKRLVEFDFECSSPYVYRLLHMQLLPFKESDGILIMNSVRIERAHDLSLPRQSPQAYFHEDIATLCAHCRRAKHATEEQWDWVPELLRDKSGRISHGICPVCRDYMYRLEMQYLTK